MPEELILRVGVAPYKQMNASCLDRYAKGDYSCEPGVELEILSILAAAMNATLHVTTASDEFGCGYLSDSGSWTGLLGMLQRDEIDVTGNLCSIEEDRIEDPSFEPSWPVLQHRQGFLIKKPKAEYKFNIFAPFQVFVWLAFATVGFSVVSLAYATARHRRRGGKGADFSVFFLATLRFLGPATSDSGHPKPKLLWNMWMGCFAFTTTVYSAYITVVVMNPVMKYRPFSNQLELVDSLLRGEYRLLDYHRDKPTFQCHSNSTCEKFQLAMRRHPYIIAVGDGVFNNSFLGQLVDSNSGNLVVVNSFYWLQVYADDFDHRRSNLWLIEDEMSGEKWFSFFRRRHTSFGRAFDSALIEMDSFKYFLPELYVGMARHVFHGKRFRGDLPETYRLDVKLVQGPGKFYAVGIALAMAVFVLEKLWHLRRRQRNRRRKSTTETMA